MRYDGTSVTYNLLLVVSGLYITSFGQYLADSFAVIAAMGLKAKGSGAVDNLVTLESVDIEELCSVAKNVQFTPPST